MVFLDNEPEDGNNEDGNNWEDLREEVQDQLERSRQEIKEIALMLEQSELELNKLAQRNATITAQLNQVYEQFDTIPRADIRMTFDSALDAQQRLFVMRGQVDKLQSDQSHTEQQMVLLEKVMIALEGGQTKSAQSRSVSTTTETLEMLIQAREVERQRLARQMHDGPAQALSNFILQTEIALRFFDLDQTKAREELMNLMTTATAAFQKVRDFIFDLRPMMLDDLGLTPTLKRYVEAVKEKASMDIHLVITGTERRLESYLEVMIFRAIQELLRNATQHSQASLITVKVDISDTSVRVNVEDNGQGFDLESVENEGGMGLKVINDRVEMLGGFFEVDGVVNQGTSVSFQVPAVKSAVIE